MPGYGEFLAPTHVGGILAQPGRHHVINDAVIEIVTRDADAGVCEGFGRGATAQPAEAQHREVAGAAAEVRDEDHGVTRQALGIEIGSGHRLEHIADLLEAECVESRRIAPLRQRVVRGLAREGDGPPDGKAFREVFEPGMILHLAEVDRHQIFEAVAAGKHRCVSE